MKKIKFSVFADLHYKKGMYIASVDNLISILDRAKAENVDFTMHLGDLCNDYIGSPELIGAFLNNKQGLDVYGLYGNHELESANNSMQYVTPLLTNKDVTWGTEEGDIGDGSIAYYHFDTNGFRFIMTDTNFSWNPTKEIWEHNTTCSYGPPAGNVKICALGPIQLEWLRNTILDAADKGLHCIVCSHMPFVAQWGAAPEVNDVQTIFKEANNIRQGTVLMAINGHWHSNRTTVIDNVVYLDVNTVRNGVWIPENDPHYANETFIYTEYDEKGNEIGRFERPLTDLWMSPKTWYYDAPLSAIVTVREDGKININGSSVGWYANVIPTDQPHSIDPNITSVEYAPIEER